MYVSDLFPLTDALFQTDDGDESDVIKELMKAFKDNSPWTRRLYDNGDAQQLLRPYALKALGAVVDDFYEATGLPREFVPPTPQPQPAGPPVAQILAQSPPITTRRPS